MKWPVARLRSKASRPSRARARFSGAVIAFPVCIGVTVLAAACGNTAGLGVSQSTKFGQGGSTPSGSTSSGKSNGGAPSTTSGGGEGNGGSAGPGIVFEGGLDGQYNNVCVPLTCAELKANCGPQGDGCGNLIDCGGCKAPETCGGGKPSVHSQCGGNGSTCKMKTCADWGANCGPVSDGCGGLLNCGTCTAPETCGGGTSAMPGVPSVCGGDSGCVPRTCAQAGANCGPIGDGCGGIVECGNTCSAPQTCGGGGVPSVCGNGDVDSGPLPCTAKTCSDLGFNCGPAGDGCGGQIDCGTCTAPQTCGGGGAPSVCGGSAGCVPLTCADLGHNCGPAGDGCGNTIDCGTCAPPATCGGGGPGLCGGANNCVPTSCVAEGFNCGPAGDGCGGLLQCGLTCPAGEICGGGGKPGVCGPLNDAGTSTCTGLCLQQQTCDGGGTTTISGTVYAPNGVDPLYNALVYVPNGGPAPSYGVTGFTTGVHCGQCGTEVSGSPLVSTNTAPDGTFQLQNVPVGSNIPVIIQLGRWRHGFTIPSVPACTNTALTSAQTSLPSKEPVPAAAPPPTLVTSMAQADNIPLIAFSTGSVDALECVFLQIGVDPSQFSNPALQGGTGRIRFYEGEGAGGQVINAQTPGASQLWQGPDGGGTPDIDQYDMVFFPCQGNPYAKTAAEQQVVINYANAGGRVFGTHYSYVWYDNDLPFSSTAKWAPGGAQPVDQVGYVNTGFPRGQALAQWLQITGSSTTYGQIPLNTLRNDFTNVVAPSLLWLTLTKPDPNAADGGLAPATNPMHYTFDTPVGNSPATQCGRALFDDFHVYNTGADTGTTFPGACPAGAMTPQQKLLEFMIFDLEACIIPTTYVPPTCTPVTCASQNISCGPAGDGCGGQLDCGNCTLPETCGGGGVPGKCGGVPCTPVEPCASQGKGGTIECGPASNGCGSIVQCGNCPNGQTCGGGGMPGICGKPTCRAETCKSQGIQCGPAGDGCGGILECGNCPAGETCGGGGKPGVCAGPDASTCMPITCQTQGIQCGPAGDGCGGQLACGMCTPPDTCGGGGVPGICGAPTCVPQTCSQLGLECGPAGDGCGGEIPSCGTCPVNEVCGGCGTPGKCGSCCIPLTCKDLGYACGPAGDGCGNELMCGTCKSPDTCGGAGIAGQCGHQSNQ